MFIEMILSLLLILQLYGERMSERSNSYEIELRKFILCYFPKNLTWTFTRALSDFFWLFSRLGSTVSFPANDFFRFSADLAPICYESASTFSEPTDQLFPVYRWLIKAFGKRRDLVWYRGDFYQLLGNFKKNFKIFKKILISHKNYTIFILLCWKHNCFSIFVNQI